MTDETEHQNDTLKAVAEAQLRAAQVRYDLAHAIAESDLDLAFMAAEAAGVSRTRQAVITDTSESTVSRRHRIIREDAASGESA